MAELLQLRFSPLVLQLMAQGQIAFASEAGNVVHQLFAVRHAGEQEQQLLAVAEGIQAEGNCPVDGLTQCLCLGFPRHQGLLKGLLQEGIQLFPVPEPPVFCLR